MPANAATAKRIASVTFENVEEKDEDFFFQSNSFDKQNLRQNIAEDPENLIQDSFDSNVLSSEQDQSSKSINSFSQESDFLNQNWSRNNKLARMNT